MTDRRVTARNVPSPAVVAVFALLVVAAVGYFVTGRPDDDRPVAATLSASPSRDAPAFTPTAAPAVPTEVPRAYVEIFNNSGIAHLADTTSAAVRGAGWKVVGVDNWYGTIPATTVYYPRRLKAQAALLARDLKIGRLRPAVSPMKPDRLTVILTRRL